MSDIKVLVQRERTLKLHKDARKAGKSPDQITIFYDEFRKLWAVKETYVRRNSTGKLIYGGIEKRRGIGHYSKYLFNEYNHAPSVSLDTLTCPDISEEQQDLFTFSVDGLRKEAGIDKETPFTIDFIQLCDDETPYFYIIPYKREELEDNAEGRIT